MTVVIGFGYSQGIVQKLLGCVLGTFRERSGNVQGTGREVKGTQAYLGQRVSGRRHEKLEVEHDVAEVGQL
jgi:hypothetical protein